MQAEANKDAQPHPSSAPEAAEPRGSWVKTFALVAAVTLLILGGIGFAVYHMGGDNLPMNYPGFENK